MFHNEVVSGDKNYFVKLFLPLNDVGIQYNLEVK